MNTGNSLPAMIEVRKNVQTIPGRKWGFHPAVPLSLIIRHPEAQRPSTLDRLRKKAGEYDANKAGFPRLVPNGQKFYAVTGATRTEWAGESGMSTTPAEVWPEEMSVGGMAAFFLDELVHVQPGGRMVQKIGEVALKPIALAVKEARARYLGSANIVGAFRTIYQKKNGPALIRRTVDELQRLWPDAQFGTVSASVVAGMCIVLENKQKPANKWKGLGPQVLLEKARTRQARQGGKGSVAAHVAAVLRGART